MLLITIFVELRLVAGRSRTRTGCLQAVSTTELCRGLEKNGMVRAWHGRSMASVNQTPPHCVNQMGKTHSKPLAARHGRGTAWARHAMCESAFTATTCLLLGFPMVIFNCRIARADLAVCVRARARSYGVLTFLAQ
jgi:hypothetical protein